MNGEVLASELLQQRSFSARKRVPASVIHARLSEKRDREATQPFSKNILTFRCEMCFAECRGFLRPSTCEKKAL